MQGGGGSDKVSRFVTGGEEVKDYDRIGFFRKKNIVELNLLRRAIFRLKKNQ